jgi:hypothetical protein
MLGGTPVASASAVAGSSNHSDDRKSPNCLNNSLEGNVNADVLTELGSDLLIMMGGPVLGTFLFYGAIYLLKRRQTA